LFKNHVPRRMCESKRKEVTGGWRKLLCITGSFTICTLHQIFRKINSRRMRWMDHITCMTENTNAYKVLMG
jgi:hypothetical protein